MLYVPTPSVSLMVAVPAVVSCACPKIAESAQRAALASQNTTRPRAIGDPPAVTFAVSVTAVPAVTCAEEMLKVVVVACTPSACPRAAGTQAGDE